MARRVDVPAADGPGRQLEGEHPALPLGLEDGPVGSGLDRAEAHHAAEIVRAVHGCASRGESGSPVPIMLSRVTSPARRASSQSPVPAGRSGSTR